MYLIPKHARLPVIPLQGEVYASLLVEVDHLGVLVPEDVLEGQLGVAEGAHEPQGAAGRHVPHRRPLQLTPGG